MPRRFACHPHQERRQEGAHARLLAAWAASNGERVLVSTLSVCRTQDV